MPSYSPSRLRPGESLRTTQRHSSLVAALLASAFVACSAQPPLLADGGASDGGDGGVDAGDGGDAGVDAGLRVPDAGPQFAPPIVTSVSNGVAALAAADFDGDGKQDLIVSMGDPGTVSGLVAFLAGKGDGTFADPVLIWTGLSPRGVAALDIDGDGRPDFAVGVCADGGNQVSYFIYGDGGFGARNDVPVAQCPYALSAADLDGDGRTDLVVAAPGPFVVGDAGNGEVDVLRNRGGALELADVLPTTGVAVGITTADLDGDGRPDIVATATSVVDGGVDAELRVWLSADGGSDWRSLAPLSLENGGYRAVTSGDIDRDGLQDIALVSARTGTLAVLLGKGDGTFLKPQYQHVSGNPLALGLADFRHSGWVDLVVSDSNVFPFLGMSVFAGGAQGAMPLGPEVRTNSYGSTEGLAIADFTGDGIPDVALSESDFGSVGVLATLSGPPILPDPATYHPAPHAPNGPLFYNGGPIIDSPSVITINYRDDPSASVYEGFDDWIVTSDWLATIGADYGIGLGTNQNIILDGPAPTSLLDSDIRTLLYELILDGGLPPPTSKDGGQVAEQIYFLYLPAGTTVSDNGLGQSCQNFGGYHSENDMAAMHFAYAVIPTCDPNAPYYQEQAASHELAEASSDPLVGTAPAYANPADQNGWVGEIGDLCTLYGTGYQMPDGGPFYSVQRIWSIGAADAGQQPCIPATRGPYANVSPDAGPDIESNDASLFVGRAGQTFNITLTGWASVPSVPFGMRVGPWGVGLVPASFGLGVSWDKTSLTNGEEATLTVTVPADAPHHSAGIATIFTGFEDTNYAYWPIVVFVP
jgi:hypothetical protein